MKVDPRKDLKHLYYPGKEPALVEVSAMNFLMVEGFGDPNTSQDYRDAIEALYSVSYTLKFIVKKADPNCDYAVMPLEGLWWVEDMSQFSVENKDSWQWTAMIMQPVYVTLELFAQALDQVRKKKDSPALSKIRFEAFDEGLSAQIKYIGPYSAEGPTIARLHEFIREKGYALRGKHHEIYMSDPRRTAPEKLVTIIRQPVGGVAAGL